MFRKLMERYDRLMGRGVIDDEFYDELEEALLQADTNIAVTTDILNELKRIVRDEKVTDPRAMRDRLKQAISARFGQQKAVGLEFSEESPSLFVFVGVNGVGKTTTIAKVAYLLKRRGFSVILAAGDTFRAAAIEQLEAWAAKVGVDIIKNQPGSDSGAVIFDAIQAAKARGVDFVLADTAGRQHSKENLMQELSKIRRIAEKGLGRAPDEVLLVLDANTGQNAISQAENFLRVSGVTGIVLTKLDSTAKGGALIGVYDRFKVPIKLVGVGEKMEDLKDFKPQEFAASLFE